MSFANVIQRKTGVSSVRSLCPGVQVPSTLRVAHRGSRLAAKQVDDDTANPFVGGSTSSSSQQQNNQSASQEAKLEALETAIRRGKKAAGEQSSQKKMQIRGVMEATQEEKDAASSIYAEWKPWQLFPEGWEQMSLRQQLTELWVGRRGFLFWLNKAAYASVLSLAFGWVVFRFVGPALGLYQLAGDIRTTL